MADQSPVTVTVYVHVPGADQTVDHAVEIPRDKWAAMSPEERHEFLRGAASDWQNIIAPAGFMVPPELSGDLP